MLDKTLFSHLRTSHLVFAFSLCFVILFGWMPLVPNIKTFMFTWRVELAASIFITALSACLIYNKNILFSKLRFSTTEIYLIILPLSAFIMWSGLSALWAFSWKAALFHTAVWIQYLVFYIVTRQILNSNGNYKTLMTILTVMLLMIGVPVIVEYCSFLYLQAGTTLGIRFSKYAEIINLLCPLIVAAVMRMSGRKFVAGIICVSTLWLFIISTISRTGLILFVTGILIMGGLVFTVSQFKKYRRKMVILVLALTVSPIPIHLISYLSPTPDIPVISRLSNSAASNNSRKMLGITAAEIIKTNPFTGIGADNFGYEANNYRAAYGEQNPDDVNLAASEAEVAERTHNEYLQIFSELGIVGVIIFGCFLSVVAVLAVNLFKRRKEISLFPFAALCGVCLFLVSSAVSSYSFRLIQNGFIFFFVLAIASKLILKNKKDSPETARDLSIVRHFYKPIFALGILAGLFLGTVSIFRATSASYSNQLLNLPSLSEAENAYQNAVYYDKENPISYISYGLYLINEKKYSEAAPEIKKAIELGEGTSGDYSLLATAQSLSGDKNAAAETLAEAVKLYPRSTFVRTRYADLLSQINRNSESQKQRQIARSIDLKSANTWWSLINDGVAKTNVKTLKDENIMVVFDLQPQSAYEAYLIERLNLHPEEKPKMKMLAQN